MLTPERILAISIICTGLCDSCGEELVLRDDDRPETVEKRLNVYHEQTQPLIEYYAQKNPVGRRYCAGSTAGLFVKTMEKA